MSGAVTNPFNILFIHMPFTHAELRAFAYVYQCSYYVRNCHYYLSLHFPLCVVVLLSLHSRLFIQMIMLMLMIYNSIYMYVTLCFFVLGKCNPEMTPPPPCLALPRPHGIQRDQTFFRCQISVSIYDSTHLYIHRFDDVCSTFAR